MKIFPYENFIPVTGMNFFFSNAHDMTGGKYFYVFLASKSCNFL